MIHICDRVVVVDRNSPDYMQSRCVVAVSGDVVTVSSSGDNVEYKLSDVVPYDTFSAIIRYGAMCRLDLHIALGRVEKIMGYAMHAVIKCARDDIDLAGVGVDAEVACRALEAFVDVLPHLNSVGRILNACGGDYPRGGELEDVSRARSEICELMAELRNCGNDCRAGECVRGDGCE